MGQEVESTPGTPRSERIAAVTRLHDEVAADPNPAVASTRPVDTTRGQLAALRRDVRRKLDWHRGLSLLEVGCGTGVVGGNLARTASRYVGIDVSTKALGVFQQAVDASGGAGSIELLHADWLALAPDHLVALGSFDRVLAYSVLYLVGTSEEGRSFVGQVLDRLSPAGVALFGCLALEDWAPQHNRRSRLSATGSRWVRSAGAGVRRRLRPTRLDESYGPRLPSGTVYPLTRATVEAWIPARPDVTWRWVPVGQRAPLSAGHTDLILQTAGAHWSVKEPM